MHKLIDIFSKYKIIQRDTDESKDMASMYVKLNDGHAFRILLSKDDGFISFTITLNGRFIFSGEDNIDTFKENIDKFLKR